MRNDTKERVIFTIKFTLFASLVALLVLIGIWAYSFAQVPFLLDYEPIVVSKPVRVEVHVEKIVATSSDNLPAVGTTK